MSEINLNSDFITDEELKNLKKHIMKWYSPRTNDHETNIINMNTFYKDALEDLLGVWIYGHWGEHFKASLKISAWQREKDLETNQEQKIKDEIEHKEEIIKILLKNNDDYLVKKEITELTSLLNKLEMITNKPINLTDWERSILKNTFN